ncbi:hypothetical protein A0J61_04493 [Choanephora cucurbitarum]|uniref:Uncharacterized protein n=1 Tax=Choanephora cucurbitarum TaxID=101091 RepID=A0A1C7NFX5_9FUNG|nr:hypothetical protein A0J61_04493 [Choanephora cucurbitarum]
MLRMQSAWPHQIFCKQKQDVLRDKVEDSLLIVEYEKLEQNRDVNERKDRSTDGLPKLYTREGPEASRWAPNSAAANM